jgi:UDP-glucose 4-epimerase
MRILVTGGSGFLGSRLVRLLLKEKHKVAVFCSKKVPEMEKDGVEFKLGDMRNPDDIRDALAKTDVVFHLAACMDESDQDMWAINVDGTQNIVNACREHKIKHLIFMSSSGVLGETLQPATEDLPYNPKTKYEMSKAEAEKLIINSGIPYTIVRAPIIIGPNITWAAIFDAAKQQYPIIGNGKNFWHLVYIDDVANLLDMVKANKHALNQIFHVASKDVPRYEEVYKNIVETLGINVPNRHISITTAKLMATFHEFCCNLKGIPPKVTLMRSSIDRLIRNRIISIEKIRKTLGFEPRFTTRQAIKETVKYVGLIRQGYSQWEISKVTELLDDKRSK